MKTRILGGIAGAALAVLMFATSAQAVATLDPATGGFIGKGDVQKAFGWNNATMQAHHQHITFELRNSARVQQSCQTSDRGEKVVVGTRTGSTGLDAAIAADPRKTGQYTGWNVAPYTDPAERGEVTWDRPGGSEATGCPAGSNPVGPQSEIEGTSSTGLYAIDADHSLVAGPIPYNV